MMIEPLMMAEHKADRFIRLWVTYMHMEAKPDGLPTHACGGATNYTSLDLDNVAAYENLDLGLAEKTDAVINSLPLPEQCAVYHRFLYAVYRFHRGNFDEVLARAKDSIIAGLQRRDVWIGE